MSTSGLPRPLIAVGYNEEVDLAALALAPLLPLVLALLE